MEAYAVVETGGKQYLAKAGDVFEVELIDKKVGEKAELGRVLAISDGKTLKVGKPVVEGAKVIATVVKEIRGPKVVNFRFKRRKGYAKLKGHRQDLVVVKIESIG